ncbi:MAG: hypothetical protein ACRETO_03535 [Gammaproteobacteria bacterium]
MNTHPFLEGLKQSPDYLLQNLDFMNRRGLVVHVNQGTYRQAAFLDERMFTQDTQGAWFALDSLLQITSALPARTAHYIFHIGHCGSTLLSRLLGELPGCFALREPLGFLALAMARRELESPNSPLDAATWHELFEMVIRLQARCYAESDIALIKSTSVAGNLLQPAMSARADSRAILLYMDLEPWLATMLRAPGTRESVRAFTGAWLTDFRRLTGDESIRLHGLDDIRQAVISWAAMLLNFTQAAAHNPARTCWMNFDTFLAAPAQHCKTLTDFLALPATDVTIQTLTSGPIMAHYAKDPHQNFDSTARTRELTDSRRQFGAEIRAGLEWFEELTRQIPVLSKLGPPAFSA